jgi:flavin-binding protein dodecin
VAEYTGESAHSFEQAVKDAAKKVDKKATFRIKEQRGDISPNPGQINRFVVVIETTG